MFSTVYLRDGCTVRTFLTSESGRLSMRFQRPLVMSPSFQAMKLAWSGVG
jgi:hypothetical protein